MSKLWTQNVQSFRLDLGKTLQTVITWMSVQEVWMRHRRLIGEK